MTDHTKAMREALEEMGRRKDAAYEERNKVVAALAHLFPSGIARTAIEGWSDDWHGCVYIDLPTGQVSWHFHDSQARLFAGLPQYTKPWDGHDTPEKYRRLAALAQQEAPREPVACEFPACAAHHICTKSCERNAAPAQEADALDARRLLTHDEQVPDDSRTVQQIDAPDAGPMPGICEGMEKPDLWAYAHLCGYRAAMQEGGE